jgi:peptide/nickel transport system substrate-binding protein
MRMWVLLVCGLLVATACGTSAGEKGASQSAARSQTSASKAAARHGGSITVLENQGNMGTWATGLDPATTGSSNITELQAIFGGLFLLRSDDDGSNGKIVPNQAASGELSPDGKTVTIKLRPGIKFSDGTPLDAKAVIWNFERDTKSSCTCAPTWRLRAKDPFTSPDPLTVVVHLAEPDVAVLHGFPISNTNWMASPTAVKKMGAKAFTIKPVGAGPFKVASDRLNTKLVLERNPTFFKKGLPYLDGLTFLSIGGGDQPAYQALVAGQADAYEGMEAPQVTKQAETNSRLVVTHQPATAPYLIQLNTMRAPFNNIKAREAIYYATDWQTISKGLYGGEPKPVQAFWTPADLFFHATTPGFRTYDLDKAKQLVNELGGHLDFDFAFLSGYPLQALTTALKTQWAKAGINVHLKMFSSPSGLVKAVYNTGKWNAELATLGAWDPAVGVGLGFRFTSRAPFTGVKDKHLDQLLDQSVAVADLAQRDKVYQKIAKYLSDQAYAPVGFAIAPANVALKGVHGPGLTTKIPVLGHNTGVIWSEVWTEKG